MSLREDFSESVNSEVALVISTGTPVRMIDGASDRAEKHDMGCLVGYAFSNLANTEAAQKLIALEASHFRDKLLGIPEPGSVAVSWLVEESAKAGSASANSSAWEDLRLLLPS